VEGGSAVTSTKRRFSRGFSLIELVVVFSILTIVAAASIPSGLSMVRQYRITGAAQGVVAQMQTARAQAVKRNSARGVLLNFNYPAPGRIQFTSLDPSPLTGSWDGVVYPANPGVFDPNVTINYGTVPTPPNNLIDPAPGQGVQSPHGLPVGLPQDIGFEPGDRNALLFRADGSVSAVNAAGPAGSAALSADGVDWVVTLRDRSTNLSRVIRVMPGGRMRVEQP
jgi:prepilin-type N-terminal cleavage/methylation domain-containing protein